MMHILPGLLPGLHALFYPPPPFRLPESDIAKFSAFMNETMVQGALQVTCFVVRHCCFVCLRDHMPVYLTDVAVECD